MTDINKKLIELINQNKTLNEISTILHLTNRQIYIRLKNLRIQGFEFNRSYFYDGNIKYSQIFNPKDKNTNISLITPNTNQSITIMLISDIHLGSDFERLDLLFKIYNYCIQNNIHIIINCGDLIDGITIGQEKKKLNTFEEQINYLLKKYPFDKNIINFICLGNHDFDALQNNGQDLNEILYNLRHDLISVGYGLGSINIKNEQIYLKHLIPGFKTEKTPSGSLVLLGHNHKATITTNQNFLIHIPSLSDIIIDNFSSSPGATLMTIEFDKGYFKTIYLEQLFIKDKIYVINQLKSDLLPNRKITRSSKIYYEQNQEGIYIDPFTEAKVKIKK